MPQHNIAIRVRSPDGVQHSKKISLNTYTKEEAMYALKIWGDLVREGRIAEFVMPKFVRAEPKYATTRTMANGDEVEVRSSHMFERQSIDTLEMPFATGGVSFAILGSTRSGKSFAMKYIWDKYFKKHITMLMTLSKQSDIYAPMKKKALVCTGFYPELISEPMKINRETENKYKFCLIFDDLAMDGKTDKQMTKLLTIGRNSGMSAIICGQRLQMLNATGRANINYVLCFKQNTDTAVEDTVKTYLRSYFPPAMSISECCRMYKEFTQDHNFFIVDTLNDRCFLSKIEE